MNSLATTAGPVEADGSRLCLECGLCCQGAFHGTARIHTGEVPFVERLGLRIIEADEGPGFPLPCPLHLENRCTVYQERPSPCRNYRCKLLRRYLDGESTLAESLVRVQEARSLVTTLRNHLGPDSLESLWQKLRSLGEEQIASTLTDQVILMDLVSLLTLSRQHFLNRAQPKAMWFSGT